MLFNISIWDPLPHLHLLQSIFLMTDILTWGKWFINEVFIFIPLTAKDVEHFSIFISNTFPFYSHFLHNWIADMKCWWVCLFADIFCEVAYDLCNAVFLKHFSMLILFASSLYWLFFLWSMTYWQHVLNYLSETVNWWLSPRTVNHYF